MKLFLFLLFLLGCGNADQLTGCLRPSHNCPQSTDVCVDDGLDGICVERVRLQNAGVNYKVISKPQVQPKPPLLVKQHVVNNQVYHPYKVEDSRSSTTDVKPGPATQNVLLKRFVIYLIENGIDIRGLSEQRMHELVRAFLYKANKDKQEWPKRLLTTIQGARRLLNRNGIALSDLSDNDLDILSKVIAKAYMEQEKGTTRYWPSAAVASDELAAEVKTASAPLPDVRKAKKQASPARTVELVEDTKINKHKLQHKKVGKESKKSAKQLDEHASNRQEISTHEKVVVPAGLAADVKRKQEKKNGDNDKTDQLSGVAYLKDWIENDPLGKNFIINDPAIPKDDVAPWPTTAYEVATTTTKEITFQKLDRDTLHYFIIPISLAVGILVCGIFSLVIFFCIKSVKNSEKDADVLLPGGDKTAADQGGKPTDYEELCRQHYAHEQSKATANSTSLFKEPLLNQHLNHLGTNGSLKRSMFSPTRNQNNRNSISSASSWSEEPVSHTLDISMAHAILSYMEDHLSKEERLNEEWTALCDYKTDKVSFEVAEKNWEKNRTETALPYDHNRVKINTTSNIEENSSNSESRSYINASYIIDNDPRSPLYIAAQGPLASTVHEFWKMIWEQGCVAIVMLTPLVEETELQCARYWPDEGSCTYSEFEIHLVSEHIWCEDYLVRSLYVKNLHTGNTRTLTQFHFLSWPHDAVPPSAKHLLEMRRKVSKCFRSSNKPILVHCSDGVGRTGTYILLDLVITRMLKGGSKEMDIAATLEHLRDQRSGLVCTKEQLQFALSSVADEVNAILKVLLAEENLR